MSQIIEGMKVKVLLNPKAAKHSKKIVHGRVVSIVDGSEGLRYRVKYKTSWGMTSGWYPRDQVF